MVFRAINLKMILDRGDGGRPLRESLWLTHAVVNAAVAEIERVLLLCRGRSYHFGDDQAVSTADVQQQTLAFARKVQADNGKPSTGGDGAMLRALREFGKVPQLC